MTGLQTHSHRRRNLLTGEWVLVSPHRTQRPWLGQVDHPGTAGVPAHDANCYLCPGNVRHGGRRNPAYTGPWAFDNDFPALSPDAPEAAANHPMFQWAPETGRCRVICYSERHDRHLANMGEAEFLAALRFLFDEFRRLDAEPDIGYVLMFENRGEMMGCSNPHPHAQIWATRGLPVEAGKELGRQQAYFATHGSPLLLDYADAELGGGSRILAVNDSAVSLVPFWAAWPFETLLLPRRQVSEPGELTDRDLQGFARVLLGTLLAYDTLFGVPMPYSMGFHPRPSDGADHPEWLFHAHIYPPLLRSASVRKHMVGFEMLGMPQRDLTPEAAAERLRGVMRVLKKV